VKQATEQEAQDFIKTFKASPHYPSFLKTDDMLQHTTVEGDLIFHNRDIDHLWCGFKLARNLK
jgi:hypothetical protein